MKSNVPQKSNRFSELHEFDEITKVIDCSSENYSAAGVTVYSDTKKSYILDHDAHSIAIGETGSMKTQRYILPAVYNIFNKGESAIINDPKGEIFKRMKGFLKKKGYPVYVLNFRDPQTGSRWNPFSIPCDLWKAGNIDKSNIYIRDIAKCIYSELANVTQDSFWSNTAIDYFTGLAQIVRDETSGEALTIENIRFTNSVGSERKDFSTYLKNYYDATDKLSEMTMNIEGTILAPNETRESIRSVFSQPLSLYIQESLRDMMCSSDFDIAEIGRKKTAVFIITPAERSIYNPIISAFVKQSYSTLIDLVASAQIDGKTPIRVNYILDEFSNLVRIEDFNQMITMARSSNIRFNLVIQSLAQLYKVYSPEEAENIMNNCEAWFIFRSKDSKLHQIVTEMCGKRIEEYTHEVHSLISPGDIQRLSKKRGEVLLLISGMHPFMTTLPAIFEYPFDLPATEDEVFKPRKKKSRDIFDIRENINRREFSINEDIKLSIEKKRDSILSKITERNDLSNVDLRSIFDTNQKID